MYYECKLSQTIVNEQVYHIEADSEDDADDKIREMFEEPQAMTNISGCWELESDTFDLESVIEDPGYDPGL